MSITEKIRAALRGKTTGLTSAEIREAAGVNGAAASQALFALVKSGQLIKHKGETARTARFTLNPDKIADAPPAERKKAKKTKKKKTRRAAPPQQRARKTPVPDDLAFVPALTVDRELVLAGTGQPLVRYSAEQTVAIATLMLSNFTA